MNVFDGFPIAANWRDCDYAVCGLVLQDAQGRLCLQLRDDIDGIASPGTWCLFGGHMDPGETPLQTAIRELKEETGITAAPADMVPLFRFVPEGGVQAHHYFFHYTRPIAPSEMRVFEGAGFGFFHSGQLPGLNLMVSLREILSFLDDYVKIADSRRKASSDT